MKKYSQLLEESQQLDEALGFRTFGRLFGNRTYKDKMKRLRDAEASGDIDKINREKGDLAKESLGDIAKTFRNRAAIAALGLFLADMTIAGARARAAKAAGEDLPSSITNELARTILQGITTTTGLPIPNTKNLFLSLSILAGIGFGLVAIYNVLRLLVTKGPAYLETLAATRDSKTLAYTFKRDFDTDIFTHEVRVGSPGQGKIAPVEMAV